MSQQEWIYTHHWGPGIEHKSTKPWYRRWFCRHSNITNFCRYYCFADIAYEFCSDCDQWIRKTQRGDTAKLIRHMAGGKYE